MASSDPTDEDTGEVFEATAVGVVTPPLDPNRNIPGRKVDKGPLSKQRLHGALTLGLLGVLLGTVLAAGAILLLIVFGANSAHDEALVDARRGLATAQIETTANALRNAARRLATAPDITSALQRGDEDGVAELEARYGTAIDGVLRVRINRIGSAELALDESPPLTFTGLDVIRAAENGELAGPEFVATEAGNLLNVAAGIPSGSGRPSGTVMITYDARLMVDAVQALPAGNGHFAVTQTFGQNDPVVIAATGEGGSGEVLTENLSIRNWSLVYEAPASTPVASPLLTLPAWALLLVPAIFALVAAHRRTSRSLRADLERIVDSANALALGRRPTPPQDFALDDFAAAGAVIRDIALSLDADGSRIRPQPKAKSRAKAPKIAVTRKETTDDTGMGVDIEELEDEDDVFLQIDETEVPPAAGAGEALAGGAAAPAESEVPPDVVFRDYDIRGIVGEQLTEAHALLLGRAVGSAVSEAGESVMAVAGDCRTSTAALKAVVIQGITAAGVDVVDLGDVPTPILYHTTHTTSVRSGVIVTGSHNAPEYNGLKVVIGGETLASGRIAELRERIREGRFTSGSGSVRVEDGVSRYVDEIATDIALAQPLKVVVDCGNGIAGVVAPRLLEALGCEVLPLYCDPDGSFPNHHPDPADPRNLEDLSTVVRAEGADLGIALDGDGDRIGAVDEQGAILWPDRLMMLFARDIVGRNPGADVIFDVKCSRHLNGLIAEYGGRPIMWKTGHAHLKAKMRQTGALLGGELSGHISFGERWHAFDDGLYSAARLLEIVAGEAVAVSEVFEDFPKAVSTPEIRVPVDEDAKFGIVEKLISSGVLDQGDVTTIDGLRVDYPDGWGLVRASNTAPALTLRFEADTAGAVQEIADQFKNALLDIDGYLDFSVDL